MLLKVLETKKKNVIHSDNIYPISILEKISLSSNQVTTVVRSYTRKRSNKEIAPRDESTKANKSPELGICVCDLDVLKCGISPGSTGGHTFRSFTVHECFVSRQEYFYSLSHPPFTSVV